MRQIRLYTPQQLEAGSVIELDPIAAHHLGKVLRASAGDPVTLFNGGGLDWACSVDRIEKKSLWVSVLKAQDAIAEAPIDTHLGLCLSKGDRFDWAIQKATELGVTEITPLFSERVDVKLPADRLDKRLAQWRRIVIGACEQCGRACVPAIHPPKHLATWVVSAESALKWVLDHQTSTAWPEAAPSSIDLLIGPEGGLTEQEIALATTAGFQGLRLGPRVLRTETAPAIALGIIGSRWGDVN